ncbi:hypothetical protein ISN45_Aa07g015510 [Arabidopsis thaliana x Arabidopsis arenosa]|uniref:KIB1-4 beta-propeller domain-containing protein n=1 Tax=Arabidopsis thaliana x Arabidopsis arenosa TaxID=1240361 RepID=A0A8T1Y365_9BRAS|nr:hypothetical protein ISN45_Aa07g015510 [Arabidopsis thaliana x Arabidopsis arenosa]
MTVGFSRDGLRVKLCDNYDDSLCSPVIFYKPTDPELEEVTAYLPPLPIGSQIQSLAMSSLPKRDRNWVVVVKLLGSQLSMCRPFGSRKWINIKTKPQNINPLSSIMFSKKDKKFYIPTPGGNILCYLDPYSEDDDQIDFLDLDFDDLPESVFQELADVSTCSRTDHLVESPTGQLFLVKWYGEDFEDIDNCTLYHVTKKFMVFREEEQPSSYSKKMIYTEDIGDLCIFVGHSEAFCVPASSSHYRHKNVRLFSSTTHTNRTDGEMSVTAKLLTPIDFSFSSTPIYPFLLIDYVLNLPEYSPDGRVIRTSKTGDPAQVPKTTSILIRDKKLAEEVRHAMTVGFSHHGLGFELSENSLDILIDDQESTPSCVHLPSLPTGFRIQSLAMSSSSSDLYNSEDWVVCVKSWGSQLSLFRRGHEWINIQTSPEFIHPFSSLMYSKKDQRFYIPAPGGNYLCCLDLYFKEGDQAEFIPLFDIIPESVGPELTPLNSSSRTDHWVESPSGEQFLVKWYGHNLMRNHNKVETLVHMASQFMVFRAEESWEEKPVRAPGSSLTASILWAITLRSHNKKVRMFSSKPTYPYVLIDHLLKTTKHCSTDQVYYNDEYKDELVIKDNGLAEEVRVAMTHGIPHKYGYRVNLEKSEDNSTSLTLVSNTPSDPVKHHLPPLPSSCRIQNVAISNSPDINKQDLVVAVKFLGSDVSLCKPFSDSGSGWININTSGSVHPFSSLVYSKKNKKFLSLSPSGQYLWSLDLHFKEEKDVQPRFHYLCTNHTDPLRKLLQTDLKGFIWCSRTDHLVESPSGEHFLVKWFSEDDQDYERVGAETIFQTTLGFLVFRVDTICGDLVYTEDIGDLCIFLGQNEAYCVPSSSSPGLRPNSIYYVGSNFGVYDIATETSTTFYTKDKFPLRSTEFPYWPAPLSS